MSTTEPTTQHLSTTTDVSSTVVMAVADATDTSPFELPPLYDSIDPDALDELFQSSGDGRSRSGIHVTFTMAGCTVTVADGAVTVTVDSETATVHPLSTHVQGR